MKKIGLLAVSASMLCLFAIPLYADAQPTPLPPEPGVCTHCICGCTVTGQCSCRDCDHPLLTAKKTGTPAITTYADGCKQAVTAGIPLVTYIGCVQRDLYGSISCSAYSLTGYPASCIVVSVPNHSGATDCNGLDWRATLPITATNGDIYMATVNRPAVAQIMPTQTIATSTCGPNGCSTSIRAGLFRRRVHQIVVRDAGNQSCR